MQVTVCCRKNPSHSKTDSSLLPFLLQQMFPFQNQNNRCLAEGYFLISPIHITPPSPSEAPKNFLPGIMITKIH